ncbi:unnamed protein product [Lepeophtheirus salmonis]|uniref:(salmon louse) hypothetical protein n=1 Tax=Lepeophtheirus salmonis TaxID=72036 RepID=A0A7R8H4Y4_LEPSM|nr:unnamed protein product [Lepeophtheirus salmonis]CAF2858464.1 unnamed protein product [Lepeophtheirus salmonis]
MVLQEILTQLFLSQKYHICLEEREYQVNQKDLMGWATEKGTKDCIGMIKLINKKVIEYTESFARLSESKGNNRLKILLQYFSTSGVLAFQRFRDGSLCSLTSDFESDGQVNPSTYGGMKGIVPLPCFPLANGLKLSYLACPVVWQ